MIGSPILILPGKAKEKSLNCYSSYIGATLIEEISKKKD